jgi:hypothetical protein
MAEDVYSDVDEEEAVDEDILSVAENAFFTTMDYAGEGVNCAACAASPSVNFLQCGYCAGTVYNKGKSAIKFVKSKL